MTDTTTGRIGEYRGSIALDSPVMDNSLKMFLNDNFNREDFKFIECSYSGQGNKLILIVTFSDDSVEKKGVRNYSGSRSKVRKETKTSINLTIEKI